MGSGKHKPRQNPKPNAKLLRPKKPKSKFKKKTKSNNNPQNDTNEIKTKNKTTTGTGNNNDNPPVSTSQQLGYFVSQFQSANGVKLSSLELESIKDSYILDVSEELGQDVMRLEKHIREAFAARWKEELCEGKLIEGKIEAGSPAVLVVATSALRSIELLRIKKLIDIEALGLSRLSVILLDIHTDVKGYSLLTLPQVRDEFWDLYKNYFHQQVVQGDLRICLYGPIPNGHEFKGQSVELVGDREQLD
ncbi:uncharacterized protein LOC111279684 isoform X4 [Durio zibethinus]|uniref:Uncharacterized protein LOC111279684 isoform X4 n=1 Tax=Durio zibethinus TaxID=66656 RepID=A0A6P5X215_DURZI|nr:uncharacterized protein LOC111279684 isoform X4 [Durio zibethinus]